MLNSNDELYCNAVFSKEVKGTAQEFHVYGPDDEPVYRAIESRLNIRKKIDVYDFSNKKRKHVLLKERGFFNPCSKNG